MGLIDDVRLLRTNRDWRGRSPTPRSAEAWAPRRVRKQFPTGWARTPAARVARAVLQRGVLDPLLRLETRPEAHGTDLLPASGPVVFVANHASHLDTPLILGSLPRRLAHDLAVGAAADYFFDARWRATVTALVFNAFPIERQGRQRSMSLARALLEEGWSLLLFPEGTRSKDGWMGSFRLGAAQLCCDHKVPAVPVVVRGTYAAMPRGQAWPRPGRQPIVVRYGRPLRPQEGEAAHRFNIRLQRELGRLWAEHDVGWWTSLLAAPGELPKGPNVARWRRIWESTRPPVSSSPGRVWPDD